MTTWKYNKFTTIAIMIPLASLYSFSLDLYIPLLPKVQDTFHASTAMMQNTNSFFMLACGVGQLFFGPISDRFGRKPIIILSLTIFIIAAAMTFFAKTIETFMLARFLQALGSCGAYLCCFASIRDIFTNENDSAEMFSYLNIAIALSATLGPTIGSWLGQNFDWHAVFSALIAIATTAMFFSIFCYKETAETESFTTKKLNIKSTVIKYKKVFTSMKYQVYTLPAGLGIATFFSFYCISPYLYQQEMHLTEIQHGILYGSCGLTFLIGSFFCGKTVARTGIYKTMNIGLRIHAIGAIALLICSLSSNHNNIILVHLAILTSLFGASFMVGSGIGGTMAPFKSIAGVAFAMISFYKFLFAEMVADVVMMFYDKTALSLAIAILTINVIASFLVIYCYGNSKESMTSQKTKSKY